MLRRWRKRLLVKIKAANGHAQATELDAHVRTGSRQALDRLAPQQKHLVAFAAVGTNRQRAAGMVEHDRQIRQRLRQVRKFVDLRVEQPGIVGQAQRLQTRQATPKFHALHQAGRRGPEQAGVEGIVARQNMANTPKPPTRRVDMRLQYGVHLVAQLQIGIADDTGANPCFYAAPLGLARDVRNEFGFTDRAQRHRTGAAVGVTALQKNSGDHLVPGGKVGQQVIEQISAGQVPQMVVRIDNGQVGFQRFFKPGLEPCRLQTEHADDGQAVGVKLRHLQTRTRARGCSCKCRRPE